MSSSLHRELTMLGRALRIEASILCRVGLVVGLIGGGASEGSAQAEPPHQPEPQDPLEFGQWLGPWNLEQLFNPGLPPGASANDDLRDWAESAHAVVLPPREAGAKTLVLLVCRRMDGPSAPSFNGGDVLSKAFLLDPDDPMALQTMIVNNLQGEVDLGARDPFCGGALLTSAGDVFWASGTNVAAEAENQSEEAPVGHEYAYLVVWNAQTHAWEWQPAGTLGDGRWYASLTTLHDGRKLISGHSSLPASVPTADLTREYVTVSGTTATWATPGLTQTNDRWLNCLINPPALSLGDYPHLHVVRSQRVLWTGGRLGLSSFIDAMFQLDSCGGSEERWIDRVIPPGPHPQIGGMNSVHVINLARNPPVEAVYTIAGNNGSPAGLVEARRSSVHGPERDA